MLAKDPQKRVDRWVRQYEKKTKGRRKRKANPETVRQLKKEFTTQTQMEYEIKKILGEAGSSTILNVSYQNYGREIFAKARRYRGEELSKLIEVITQKWVGRTLDKTILDKIRDYVLKHLFPVI